MINEQAVRILLECILVIFIRIISHSSYSGKYGQSNLPNKFPEKLTIFMLYVLENLPTYHTSYNYANL